ncbi:PH domain-containing protein [Methylophaga sp. OBS4]|uniref:PH domain-containing protein n=1 Tax=Methylophaga sp. OBS4 TaxID=2991935 RepID=UPI00224FF890|nr:PH domain-containing protein [Methylophaga sp. OBS4]MCX4187150.1 PH domain-containing protein [Methylophaga sp. OBS4]
MAKESKHVKHFQQKHLKPGESVIAFGDGYIGEMMGKGDNTQHNGSLVVTDQRVAFCRKGLLGEVIETIPLKNITSVERRSMLGFRRIEIHTSHDSLKFKTGDKVAEQALAEAIDTYRDSKSEPSPQPTTESKSVKDRLAELNELHNAGLLSDDEFSAKKSEVLASL